MFKKIIGSFIISSALFAGVNNAETETIKDVELQKATNHAPIIKEEFKATGYYQVTNVKNNMDTLPLADIEKSPKRLELGKKYTVSFKNDYPIEIK